MKSALSLLCLLLTAAASVAAKPNIIYFMADDPGYGELGCYGHQKIKTPNFDQLDQNP